MPHLEVLPHLEQDLLSDLERGLVLDAGQDHAARNRHVEGVVSGLVRHDAHVGVEGVPFERGG